MHKIAAKLVIVVFCLCGALPAMADTLLINKTIQPVTIELPRHGISMDQVRNRFGDPLEAIPAVGEPPITRWNYPEFIVYFEHSTVLHSVFIIE